MFKTHVERIRIEFLKDSIGNKMNLLWLKESHKMVDKSFKSLESCTISTRLSRTLHESPFLRIIKFST